MKTRVTGRECIFFGGKLHKPCNGDVKEVVVDFDPISGKQFKSYVCKEHRKNWAND
jgi:hypothetical protein